MGEKQGQIDNILWMKKEGPGRQNPMNEKNAQIDNIQYYGVKARPGRQFPKEENKYLGRHYPMSH